MSYARLIVCFVLLLSLASAASADSQIFVLKLLHDDSGVAVKGFQVWEGNYHADNSNPFNDHTAYVLDPTGNSLYSVNFSLSHYVFDASPVEQLEYYLTLPYYGNAEKIKIYKGETLVLDFYVAGFLNAKPVPVPGSPPEQPGGDSSAPSADSGQQEEPNRQDYSLLFYLAAAIAAAAVALILYREWSLRRNG